MFRPLLIAYHQQDFPRHRIGIGISIAIQGLSIVLLGLNALYVFHCKHRARKGGNVIEGLLYTGWDMSSELSYSWGFERHSVVIPAYLLYYTHLLFATVQTLAKFGINRTQSIVLCNFNFDDKLWMCRFQCRIIYHNSECIPSSNFCPTESFHFQCGVRRVRRCCNYDIDTVRYGSGKAYSCRRALQWPFSQICMLCPIALKNFHQVELIRVVL